ncbi:hypothetical protein ACJJIF_12190 [Microbulbifer sp. SSSA002]|uniref:hypothetical protein n=1 Tax=Microbulbifer sp. SSSA002 TaxID=3243376 RepID=UPI00403A5D87
MSWRDNNIPTDRMRDHWRMLRLFRPLVAATKLKGALAADFRQALLLLTIAFP